MALPRSGMFATPTNPHSNSRSSSSYHSCELTSPAQVGFDYWSQDRKPQG
jgi:hypothetical protein